jgi:sugar phosphate isomerase/epimerase
LAAPAEARYCICNETFATSTFAEGCRLARACGYEALELAPGTMGPDPAALSENRRAEFHRILNGEGLRFAGMHLLVSVPPGLHLTTPNLGLRQKSWDYFGRLVDLSASLGRGRRSVMALGSGKQRSAVDGASPAEAVDRLREGLAGVAGRAAEANVEVLLEPLAPSFSNVVNTLAEAAAVVRPIGSPAVRTMFDTHNTVAETEPHDALIRKFASDIGHVHLNEMDGRHPGTGSYDFARVLRALREARYAGTVSVEVFHFQPSGEQIARETIAFLRGIGSERGEQ